jgi:nitrogen fixation protein NifU and related proteins
MIEELDELYREVILEHFRQPRNRGNIPGAQILAQGSNPLCGDEVTFSIELDGEKIKKVCFDGKGCAISQAAASMFTDQIQGKTLVEAEALILAMKKIMQGDEHGLPVDIGDLESLVGVRKFPVRVKCAALSWNVVGQGISEYKSKQK